MHVLDDAESAHRALAPAREPSGRGGQAVTDARRRWVAELTPAPGTHADRLLELPAGLDVWEHRGDTLVVAAEAAQLEELERRLLATVVWLCPVEEFTGPGATGPSENEEGK